MRRCCTRLLSFSCFHMQPVTALHAALTPRAAQVGPACRQALHRAVSTLVIIISRFLQHDSPACHCTALQRRPPERAGRNLGRPGTGVCSRGCRKQARRGQRVRTGCTRGGRVPESGRACTRGRGCQHSLCRGATGDHTRCGACRTGKTLSAAVLLLVLESSSPCSPLHWGSIVKSCQVQGQCALRTRPSGRVEGEDTSPGEGAGPSSLQNCLDRCKGYHGCQSPITVETGTVPAAGQQAGIMSGVKGIMGSDCLLFLSWHGFCSRATGRQSGAKRTMGLTGL